MVILDFLSDRNIPQNKNDDHYHVFLLCRLIDYAGCPFDTSGGHCRSQAMTNIRCTNPPMALMNYLNSFGPLSRLDEG
jgi:hypothetical protein